MAVQTHNGSVMTTNLTTLSEKGLKGRHRCEDVCVYAFIRVYVRCPSGLQFKGLGK